MNTNNFEKTEQINVDMRPVISLCIPSSGRVQFLERNLDAIYSQNVNTDLFEVCISDNSSDDNTENLLKTKYSDKSNIVYKKSSEHSYLNLIEALKLGSGKYLKLLNDYTFFSDNNILKYMISIVEKYDNTNSVLFFNFSNPQESIHECENIDEFIKTVSYMNTSAPCFGIYKTSFDSITNKGIAYNVWFPHLSLLYSKPNSKFVVINKKILSSVPVKKKGGYNLPMVFGKEYISMNECLLNNLKISKSSYNFLRLETLDFIATWYSMSIYDKKHCAFDFSDMDKWLSYYFSETEVKEFYNLVKKHSRDRLIRKILFLPLFMIRKMRYYKKWFLSRGGDTSIV